MNPEELMRQQPIPVYKIIDVTTGDCYYLLNEHKDLFINKVVSHECVLISASTLCVMITNGIKVLKSRYSIDDLMFGNIKFELIDTIRIKKRSAEDKNLILY